MGIKLVWSQTGFSVSDCVSALLQKLCFAQLAVGKREKKPYCACESAVEAVFTEPLDWMGTVFKGNAVMLQIGAKLYSSKVKELACCKNHI